MLKIKNNKNVYNFTLYFKVKLFLCHVYLSNSICLYSAQLRSYNVFIFKQAATHTVKFFWQSYFIVIKKCWFC